MARISAFSLMILCLLGIVAFAAESTHTDKIKGTWSLKKSVNGKEIYNRIGSISPTPRNAGFVFLDDGELKVPGEVSGSKRFTIPKGFHFRIEPSSIAENGVVSDVLLSYMDLMNESDAGFIAEKYQLDGRYNMAFDKPHMMTLSIPNIQTEYTLTFKLERAE